MEQKDYILREIEKISVMLRYIINKMLPATSVEEAEKIANEELKDKTELYLHMIAEIPKEEFEDKLAFNKGFNLENIELLADMLYTVATKSIYTNFKFVNKSLELYEFINEKSKTFSFERNEKISRIKFLLKENLQDEA